MKLFAICFLHLCLGKVCPDGWSVGINSYGAPDPMNTDRCYPTADMAKVAKCVTSSGKIEIEVHVKKILGDKPSGFDDLDDDTWTRTYEVSELTQSGTKDYLYLMKNVHIPGKSVMYRGLRIQKTVAVNLMFLCQYSLKERDVREDFKVTGQDAHESRKSSGSLKYQLKVKDDDMLIGDQINFEVIPINPDVVYALVTKCYVTRGLHKLTIFGEDDNFCYNPYVGFEIVSGFNSKSIQQFRYNAFKWSVDKAETTPENQGLLCRIKLKSTAFEEVESRVCDQTQPLIETNDDNKSNKGQGTQDRQMLHDYTSEDEEIEEIEEEEEEEIDLGPCSEQPFKATHRNVRLQNGGRMENISDKQKRGTVQQCAYRCMRKSGCGAFNYHVASRTCAYKGVPNDNEYQQNDKKGYNGYEIREECRRSLDLESIETTVMTTTTVTTVTTTWLPTTTALPEMCRGLNAAKTILPGQVFKGPAKNGKLAQSDFFGSEEDCIKLCANMDGCAGFLYMIEHEYCEFRGVQPAEFEFHGAEEIENPEKYTSYVLKDECMTKVGRVEEDQFEETTTMYSHFWTTAWTTTTESPCQGSNGFDQIKVGQVILGEIIHWKFPKEEHYGTPEQCFQWCAARPSCGAFLYYPSFRYCEYKYAADNHHYIMNESTAKYVSYTLKSQCIREELYGTETTTSTTTIVPTEFAWPE